jgi:hypothetical protein
MSTNETTVKDTSDAASRFASLWTRDRLEHTLDIIATVLLSLGALATAWSGYQAARWGGRWRFLLDGMYMNLSDDRTIATTPFRGIQATSKTVIIDPEIGYAIIGGESSSLDVVGGFRLWHLDNSVELRLGQDRVRASGTQTWADPVVGFRLKAGRGAFLSLKADIGGFGLGSELTWQVFGGLGLNVGSRLTTIIGYRYLDIDYRRNGFIYDVAMNGPLVGFGFRF